MHPEWKNKTRHHQHVGCFELYVMRDGETLVGSLQKTIAPHSHFERDVELFMKKNAPAFQAIGESQL
jgi:hypothetical protein